MVHKVFVLEHCENCGDHKWNTRHTEGQYKNAALSCNYNQNILNFISFFIFSGPINTR